MGSCISLCVKEEQKNIKISGRNIANAINDNKKLNQTNLENESSAFHDFAQGLGDYNGNFHIQG